ncbi:putative quorum-sensing-regulated virulence factor [Pseudomonas sp. 8Z]|uniref:quorum-sensing-regulated virulence factor family protein n=1 Tax=Pseudomonas sp. 8Z TaxID=2653166 RepID=UPI0012F2655F|nr:quorum-sensing-regulated virulence factor family protein [Pseudomonas sp. 8Z]VXC91074.1 putative quorum-sensing-regulated virulence factor [Pseudomonas sp. 8Z]
MLRYIIPALALSLTLPMAQAASLKEMELTQLLEKVAQESSVGTPRAINADILDQGYTVDGHTLINHLSVRSAHAAKMRGNPDTVRSQLAASVCRNNGYRQLMSKGAQLRYQFSEYHSNRPITTEVFDRTDCGL